MSIQPIHHELGDHIPVDHSLLTFGVSDRLRKAMDVSGLSVQDMADYLDSSRNTISRWINGVREPKLSIMRLWALRTGVPLEWIVTGELKAKSPSPGGDGLSDPAECARRDSNPQPSDP
jgi:transcriptional regulator with XRE-family HTH domain